MLDPTPTYRAGAAAAASGLADAFCERGYAGPTPVFSERECQSIVARLKRESLLPPLDWDKGAAATSPGYYALATHDRLLGLVTALIGEDVLLWGASLITQGSGRGHPWHTDIETAFPSGATVSVWIGLINTDARSSLKLVPFSHRFGETLQQVRLENDVGRSDVTDAHVRGWARDRDDRSGVLPIDASNGEAVLFDGRLWHGSHNLTEQPRCAALLQYATPETPIRIPNPARLEWPFDTYRVPRPPCIVVSGRDTRAVNRLVPGAAAAGGALPTLTSRIHSLRLPLDQDPVAGWKPHHLFQGATPAVGILGCHVSVLDPGRQPHPAHRHEEEELLVILDGEADLVVEDGPGRDTARRHRVQRGAFAYYPAHFAHTISNSSDAPVTYLMYKWTTDRGAQGDLLDHRLIPPPESHPELRRDDSSGFSTTRVLEGSTRHLWKLHAHITVLEPGAGYAPHVDAYDVGIVVLAGTVETLGERVGPHGVVFYAAGEPHGMKNTGDEAATYLVFEFHGRQSKRQVAQDPDPTSALRRVVRSLVGFARSRLPTG